LNGCHMHWIYMLKFIKHTPKIQSNTNRNP
jgi:hypothetical protein